MTLAWLIGLGVLINVVLTIIGLEILQLLGLWPIPESSPKTCRSGRSGPSGRGGRSGRSRVRDRASDVDDHAPLWDVRDGPTKPGRTALAPGRAQPGRSMAARQESDPEEAVPCRRSRSVACRCMSKSSDRVPHSC